jgi:hypothetical protein
VTFTRRAALVSAAAATLAGALAVQAGEGGWIEVSGYAQARGPGDVEAARRRALADALLSAALAGGAELRGHSVLSKARLTSDLLVVRPTGRVLAHSVLSAVFDGTAWTLRIRARVAPGGATGGAMCGVRRRLTITALRPAVTVRAAAPAWSGPVAADLVERLLRAAAGHRAVTGFTRLARALPGSSDLAGERYRTLTRGAAAVAPGDHVMEMAVEVAGGGRGTDLTVSLRLNGPMGEGWVGRHRGTAREPAPSPLGRSAVLVTPLRAARAEALVRGAEAVLDDMLDRAACREVAARLVLTGGRLVAAVGADHGLSATALAYVPEDASASGLLEVAELGRTRVVLRPLDPDRPASAFSGRSVRFILVGQALP